jgi:hypothetical protein
LLVHYQLGGKEQYLDPKPNYPEMFPTAVVDLSLSLAKSVKLWRLYGCQPLS